MQFHHQRTVLCLYIYIVNMVPSQAAVANATCCILCPPLQRNLTGCPVPDFRQQQPLLWLAGVVGDPLPLQMVLLVLCVLVLEVVPLALLLLLASQPSVLPLALAVGVAPVHLLLLYTRSPMQTAQHLAAVAAAADNACKAADGHGPTAATAAAAASADGITRAHCPFSVLTNC